MPIQRTILAELEDALAHGSAERRSKTLSRITDLFVFGSSRFSDDHIAVFDGIFNHLIADIELSARERLAERLADLPHAPPQVIRTLAFDDAIGVAGPVLTRSDALDNATLVENASTQSQDHLLAISRRKTLAETVTDVLVERGNRDVALSAVRNAGAKFSETGYVRLVKRSEGDEELTRSVGARPEIPRRYFLKLLTSASQTVRAALESAHPQFVAEVDHVVADVAASIQASTAAASRDYIAARTQIDTLRASGNLNEGAIEGFARACKFEETVMAIAAFGGLPQEIVERALGQGGDETVLIVAKAAGLSWPTTRSVLFLCTEKPGPSPHALEQSRTNFYKLKRETALQVIQFHKKRLDAQRGQKA